MITHSVCKLLSKTCHPGRTPSLSSDLNSSIVMQPLPAGERLRASVILSGGAAGAASDEEELPHHKARADTPIVAASPCVHRTPLALVPSSPGWPCGPR